MSLFCPANRLRRAEIIDEQEKASSETPSFSHYLTLAPDLGELRGKFRQRRIKIRDQAVIGDLEDWRLLVLVDGDDDLRILHAGEMLDRAGDADRDVKLRCNNLAGLADLVVVGDEAGIDCGARRADRGPELVRDRLQQVEIV